MKKFMIMSLLISSQLFAQELLDEIVAVVDDSVIMRSDLNP